MSDWLKPDVTADSYVNYTNFLKNRDVDLATGLDPAVVTVTSAPTNAIRWNSANGYWEKFNGTTWAVLAATYHIAVDSAAAVPFSGVSGKPTTLAGYGITDAAPLASPALTGTPTAPTAAVDTNTTQLATTAYVIGQAYAKLASPTFTGVPAAPTAAVDTNTTQLATTAYVMGQAYAKLASPTFTGVPAAPTAAVDTNTTQLATTAYVMGQAYAKLASPTFTGTPAAPTPAFGDNDTSLATTAFVQGREIVKRKTEDESVASSTVLQDDDHLTFAIAANEEWEGTFQVDFGSALTTTGIKAAITAPSGATLSASGVMVGGGATPALIYFRTVGSGTAFIANTPSSSGIARLTAKIWVLNGATPGNVTLQWAQNASSAINLIAFRGSTLNATRIG